MQCNAELNLSCLTHKMIECNRILSVLPKPKVIAPLGNAAGIGAANAEKARALQRVENYELKAKRQAEQSSLRRAPALKSKRQVSMHCWKYVRRRFVSSCRSFGSVRSRKRNRKRRRRRRRRSGWLCRGRQRKFRSRQRRCLLAIATPVDASGADM